MAHLGLRTIYGQEDLKRASRAPGKIVGMYESMKGDNFDSGIGKDVEDEMSMGDDPPAPPKLITDTEMADSGLGNDEIETDHVAVETRASSDLEIESSDAPGKSFLSNRDAVVMDKPVPRRPRRTIAPNPGTKLRYNNSPRQPTSTALGERVGIMTVPAQAESEVQRLHLQNQWQRILFQQQLNYLLPNRDGDTGLHLAVIHARPDILTQLLALVASDARLQPALDEQNSLYQSALHIATHTQQVDIIQKLLAAGASLDLSDHKGNTPLHISCRFSSTKCLEELVRGVPLDRVVEAAYIRNHQGQTCIHEATERGNTDALRKMKSIGIDMNIEDFQSGKTPLHLAVEKCSLTDVQFLVEVCQVDVNRPTYSGCTPLHTAAGRGNIAVVAYLLSMGADPDMRTDEGDSPLDLAGSEQVEIILNKADALTWLNA